MSFLQDYRTFNSGNEAHPTYHAFCGLLALSSIISRRVWLSMDYFTIYPNLYVVLVGPAGNRKTSAMSSAKKLLRELGNVPFSGECISKEKLILDMVDEERSIEGLPDGYAENRIYSPMTVCVTELSEFLQISGSGMIGFLTDVYDQPFYDHKTKNKGSCIITGPFLNLLACTTPEWIGLYLRSDIISGGFSRRCIFVYETEKAARIPFPEITDEMRRAWINCNFHAQKVQNVKGPFVWLPETRKFYADWYISLKSPTDPNTIGYYETKHIQLLKIAMLVALSESTELILRINHLAAAMDILSLVEQNLPRVFQNMGKNQLTSSSTKLLDLLRQSPITAYKTVSGEDSRAPMFPTKKLRAALWQDVDDDNFNKIIEHLTHTDRVFRLTISTGGVSREYLALKTT